MSLSDIAEDIGTIHDQQQDDDHDRLQTEEVDTGDQQNEYDGGFTVDH